MTHQGIFGFASKRHRHAVGLLNISSKALQLLLLGTSLHFAPKLCVCVGVCLEFSPMLHETPGLRLAGVGRPREITHFLLVKIVWFEGSANLPRGSHNPETQRVQRQEVRLQTCCKYTGQDERYKYHEKEGPLDVLGRQRKRLQVVQQ